MRALPILALAACCNAHAGASATLTIFNRTPTVIAEPDGSTRPSGNSAELAPGERLTYEFDYTIAVADGGAPATWADGPFWNAATALVYSGGHTPLAVPLHGTEFALANLYFDTPWQSSFCPPWVSFSATWDYLATGADDAPQALSKSSHGFVSLGLIPDRGVDAMPATLPEMRIDTLALQAPVQPVVAGFNVSAAPIPEPTEWLLLAWGVGVLVLRAHWVKRR